jgi:thiamine biosynthesis lipoprotein
LAAKAPVTTDPDTFHLIERALSYSRRTGGAFDITVGRLMKAWGFFRDTGRHPSTDELAQALAQTGWEYVKLGETNRTVRFLRRKLELDLGAVGKGYALDRVASLLRAHGVEAALVGAGQSTYIAVGAPPGSEGWPVHVPDAHDSVRRLTTVMLCDGALSTSGDSETFFELEGERYGHILDPRTGYPVKGMVQVTVISSRAEVSDVLSTSLFVMGLKEGARLLDEHSGSSALLITDGLAGSEIHAIDWPASISSK